MKKIVPAVILCALLIGFGGAMASSTGSPSVFVNGKEIAVPVIVQDQTTYVPLRAVSEALSADVQWDQEAYAVRITMDPGAQMLPSVIEAVSPSVVGIIGSYTSGSASYGGQPNLKQGSGVIIKASGEILTNAHVVKGMEVIVVVLANGEGYTAQLKYYDEITDLAVIQIQKSGLPVAKFAAAGDLTVGESVVAIGTPLSFSLQNSAAAGIISGVDRAASSDYYLIQTDTAINPGNSGGPLVNMKGEVVGINSSGFVGLGVSSLNFSIPVDTINYVLSHFENYGTVRRPKLGAAFSEDWAAQVGLPSNKGLTVTSVSEGSAAQAAGLKSGDVIIAVNGTRVNSVTEWNECMKKHLPGGSVTLKVISGGTEKEVAVVLK